MEKVAAATCLSVPTLCAAHTKVIVFFLAATSKKLLLSASNDVTVVMLMPKPWQATQLTGEHTVTRNMPWASWASLSQKGIVLFSYNTDWRKASSVISGKSGQLWACQNILIKCWKRVYACHDQIALFSFHVNSEVGISITNHWSRFWSEILHM